ncbi:MAG: hypothetical protein GX660_28155, partial [Clostridiaceae bacterium]|nr:hypothetical protein [Clostridiaceae bacterium]
MKKIVSTCLAVTLMLSSSFAATAPAYEGRQERYKNATEHYVLNDTFNVSGYVKGKLTSPSKDEPEKIIRDYFGKQTAKSDLIIINKTINDQKKSVVKTQQTYEGIKVTGTGQSYIIGEDGVIENISGINIPDIEDRIKGSIVLSEDDARSIVEKDLGKKLSEARNSYIEKVILPQTQEAVYAYSIKVSYSYPVLDAWEYLINAENGKIIKKQNALLYQSVPVEGTGVLGDTKKMTGHYGEIKGYRISPDTPYTLADLSKLPPEGAEQKPIKILTYELDNNKIGTIASDNDGYFIEDPSKSPAVDAHYFASKVYDYYRDTFGRYSFDNAGSDIVSYVHATIGGTPNNACWDPINKEMSFGDGDGVEYISFACEADSIGHEFTHGVVMSEADIEYNGQFGAINEAFADLFGEAFEAYVYDREPDWAKLVEAYTPNIAGDVKIDLKNPGLTKIKSTGRSYPDHMEDLYIGEIDSNGVHINASILTKAFSLMSDGGEFHNVKVPAIGLDKLTKIMYKVITEYLTAQTTFNELAIISQDAAAELYTKTSKEYDSIRAGFQAVGILYNTSQWNIYSESGFKSSAGTSAAMMVGDRAYALGGLDIYSLSCLDDVWEYSFPTNTWVQKSPLPKKRGFFNATSANGKGYALFGYEDFLNQSGHYTTVDEYDPLTDKWTTVAELPKKQVIAYGSYNEGSVITSPVTKRDSWLYVKTGQLAPGASIEVRLQKSEDNVNFTDERVWNSITSSSTTTELVYGVSKEGNSFYRLVASVRGGTCTFGIDAPYIRTGSSLV